jgi:hypothetical protein
MPTYYLEPFGGVNVEAQLCGTPVITSDWGAFPETVLHGVTGYRCRVFEEFCWAVNHIHEIKPADCRAWAEHNYSMDRIGRMYEEYFQRLYRLFDMGWYEPNGERCELDWLRWYYPAVHVQMRKSAANLLKIVRNENIIKNGKSERLRPSVVAGDLLTFISEKEFGRLMDDRKNGVMSPVETAGKSGHKLRMVLISVLTMTFMMALDSSILNVALPTLAEDLNVPTSQIDWATIAYMISLCSLVLMFGKIADIIGRTKVFQLGTLIFTVGSLLCSISGSFIFLIFSRLIQGAGASAAMSSNLGIITESYPVTKRAKALSSVSSSIAVGMLIGPIAGGFILNYFSWQVIFLINLPIGVFAFILGMLFLPKSSGSKAAERIDIGGGVFIVLAIAAVISALTLLQTYRDFYLYTCCWRDLRSFLSLSFSKNGKEPADQDLAVPEPAVCRQSGHHRHFIHQCWNI